MGPKILMSARGSEKNYEDAVRFAGGEPVFDTGKEKPEDFDALILCGGGDIHPKYYGEDLQPETQRLDEERDERELLLTDSFVRAEKPILGICRGHQLLHVYFKGKLIQHLPGDHHRSLQPPDKIHLVTAREDSFLYRLYGKDFVVNSCHHQAVKTPGRGLVTVLTAPDGVNEASCHEKLPVWCVQWHPERLRGDFARSETVSGDPLFAFFLAQCKK